MMVREFAARSPQDDALKRPLRGVRVLVVDDNLDHLDIMDALLRQAGAWVETARSAQEAFDRFQADPPAVVVSDLAMPEGTGYQLIRQIRTALVGNTTPVIAVTAFGDREIREKALAHGFDEWVAKPASDAIVRTVARVASARREV
jgi:CheY-like chemotaxis protein